MDRYLEDIIYNITSDDFVDDSPLFERWFDVVDIEIGDGPPTDGNFLREPKMPINF